MKEPPAAGKVPGKSAGKTTGTATTKATGKSAAKSAGKTGTKVPAKSTGTAGTKTTGKPTAKTTGTTGTTAATATAKTGEKTTATAAGKAATAAGKPAEAPASEAQQVQRQRSLRLQQTDAEQLLRQAGLRWTSSGGCSNRQGRNCTSLQAVRSGTISSAIDLKRRSGCRLVVTGGTEVGHAPGPYSHFAGYKLDIKPNACINRYIKKNHPKQGVRGDGARLYGEEGASEPLYAREADHWDILFR
ncbi:hypothetical protein [Streptosporangium longisporum]|uniref:hypothetical protein n=1 Tax=Streptosporangium longisporum TaxID=46187 RepID=UPI0031E6AC7F